MRGEPSPGEINRGTTRRDRDDRGCCDGGRSIAQRRSRPRRGDRSADAALCRNLHRLCRLQPDDHGLHPNAIARADTAMLPVESTMPYRTVMLGVLLCLYPLGQFFGSPILGSRSDRFGDGRYCSFHCVRRRHAMRKATSSSHRGDCRHRLAHTAQSLLRLYLWRAVSPTSSVRSVAANWPIRRLFRGSAMQHHSGQASRYWS